MNRLIALAILLFPSVAFAGGWTQPQGDHYVKVWGSGVFGSSAFDLQGEELPTESYRLLALNAYGEYGLADDLTLVAFMTPAGSAVYGERSSAYTGPLLVGFRRRFVDSTLQLALEARIGGAPGWGDRNLADAEAPFVFVPTVRTWQREWELQLAYPLPFGWVSLAVGPTAYSNPELSHAVKGFLQVGGQFGDFVVDLHSTLHYTFDPPTLVNVTGASDTRYVGVGLGVSWWPHRRLGVHVGADGGPYARANAYAPALQVGVESR